MLSYVGRSFHPRRQIEKDSKHHCKGNNCLKEIVSNTRLDLQTLSGRLDLGFNQLNATLPESIGQLPQLQFLSIPSNSLQGTVSANHLFGLSKLRDLDLSFISLKFNISLDQVPMFQDFSIRLASCKLGPRFPHWLNTQKYFKYLISLHPESQLSFPIGFGVPLQI